MGAVVGGLVGGVFGGGGLLGGVMSNMLGGVVDKLVDQFGLGDIAQAITNLAGDILQTGLNSIIDGLPIPDFLKDTAKQFVADAVGAEQAEVPEEAQTAVNEELGGTIDDIVQNFIDMVQQQMQEESEESGGGEGGKGNWLVVLASALGKASGEHLEKMVALGEKMGSMESGGENAGEFADVQAQFQAETKIFTMFQESISTMIKSIGEGMASVARKT